MKIDIKVWKKTNSKGSTRLPEIIIIIITLGLTTAEGKDGWIANIHEYYSGTSHAFNIAGIAFIICFVVTVLVSLVTVKKPEDELRGLVYSLTPRQTDKAKVWYKNPLWLGVAVLIVTLLFNVIFF